MRRLAVCSLIGFALVCAPADATPLAGSGGGAAVLVQPFEQSTRPLEVSFRGARGVFATPERIAGPGASEPVIAANARGDAIAAWASGPRGDRSIRAAFRPAGGRFGRPEVVSSHRRDAMPRAAINANGAVVVLWTRGRSELTAWRPAGGPFAEPQVAFANAGEALIGLDDAGRTVAAAVGPVQGDDGVEPLLWVTSDRGGAWTEPHTVMALESTGLRELRVNGSGQVLASWIAAGRYWTGEASPGGALTAVRPPVEARGELRSIGLGAGGHAALVYERGRRLWLSRRAPGGSWAPASPIGPDIASDDVLSDPAVAIDGGGNAALAWRSDDFAVHSVYAPFDAAPRYSQLWRLTPGRFAGPELPSAGVAIDNGSAVAAWEESNGEQVDVVARSFGPRGAGRRQRIARRRHYERRRSSCRPPSGSTVLRSNREAVVYKLRGGSVRGCSRLRGLHVGLVDSEYQTGPHAIDLEGSLVGYDWEQCDTGCDYEINVTDLRDPEHGLNVRGEPDGESDQLGSIQVSRTGGYGWIECAYGKGCAPGTVSGVYKLDSDEVRSDRLARGRSVSPRSLTLQGSTLAWLEGGRRRTATLR